ncbi:MAG: aminopeptidase P family protein [Acidobacteria bacterium]|nr:aminopeptidase P family protein [Acidobacteriota bacterium]
MFSRRDFCRIGGLSVALYGSVRSLLAADEVPPPDGLTDMVKDVRPLPDEAFAARREKARALMTGAQLDALWLESGTDLTYFTNVRWGLSERTFGVLLPRRGEPVWICPAFELERAQERIPAGQAVRTWKEHESPYALIGGTLKDLGAGPRLGLGPTVRAFQYFGLGAAVPQLELRPGAPVTEGCRGIKSEQELAYMDLANRILKLAYRRAFRHLKDGMTPDDLRRLIGDNCQRMGVSGGGWPQFGQNSAYPHGSMVRRDLEKGGIVLVDGGCSVEGYRADVTRTVVFGPPTDRQRRVWDIVYKAQQAAYAVVRPGVTCEAVDASARRVIEAAGFGPGYTFFAHRLGHGIGLDGHEYPYLVRGNTLTLQPGMTFSNEPGIYIYGEFGVRIEDCFAVTEDGYRVLGGLESTTLDQPFGE